MEFYKFTTPCSYSCHFLSFLLTLLFIIINLQTCLAITTTSSTQTYNTYIKTACNSTLYPQVCYESLSSYASQIQTNPQKLCTTALTLALRAAQNTSSTVSKVSKQAGLSSTEVAVIKDCVDNVKDSISELQDSLNEMGQLNGSDVEFRVASVKTWVSAALTDENTCTDGFNGKNVNATVKNKIREYILNLSRLTSNALALINSLKY
jgi:pectinesterase inhibitor-like protein